MHNMMAGPLWGVIAVASVGGVITIACFIAMFWWMIRPGEKDPRHPKYDILRPDR
jgi:cbb3-type cytochrome oxidase subunit 3